MQSSSFSNKYQPAPEWPFSPHCAKTWYRPSKINCASSTYPQNQSKTVGKPSEIDGNRTRPFGSFMKLRVAFFVNSGGCEKKPLDLAVQNPHHFQS